MIAALAVVVVGVAAFGLSRSDSGDDRAPARSVTSVGSPDADTARTCGRILARPIHTRKSCRTSTASVVVAPMQKPVLLGEVDVRVYRAELHGKRLTLRVRTRNNFEKRDLVVRPTQRQFYVSANGTKVYASFPRAVIEAKTAEVMDLEFPFDRAQLRRIKARHSVADLTVVPLSQVQERTPNRLGLVRLRISSV